MTNVRRGTASHGDRRRAASATARLDVARFALTFCGLLGAAAVAAHAPVEPLPPGASAVLQHRFPQLRVLSRATGALHADGVRDLVVVLGRAERGARIVSVLWGDGAGGWRFADASGDIDAACASCDVSVRVRDRELEVSASDPGDAMASVRAWRFAYRGAKGNLLRLVGVRNEQIWHGDGADGVVDDRASTDLLTGAKLDVIEGDLHGRRERREAATRVPLRQPVPFGEFSFDLKSAPAESRLLFARDFSRR